jgi:hypothetical protein
VLSQAELDAPLMINGEGSYVATQTAAWFEKPTPLAAPGTIQKKSKCARACPVWAGRPAPTRAPARRHTRLTALDLSPFPLQGG